MENADNEFQCPDCERSYLTAVGLAKHCNSHHSQTKELPLPQKEDNKAVICCICSFNFGWDDTSMTRYKQHVMENHRIEELQTDNKRFKTVTCNVIKLIYLQTNTVCSRN